MTPDETLIQLSEVGVVAVLRAPDWRSCVQAGEALVAGGVLAVEVTYSTPTRSWRSRLSPARFPREPCSGRGR